MTDRPGADGDAPVEHAPPAGARRSVEDSAATTAPGRRGGEPVRDELRGPAELQAGAVVGSYEIEARRGGGGFASVYRARDRRSDAVVALKVLHAYLARAESVRRRFRREAETIARLADPRIVRLLDFGEHGELPYLVMEWIDGETLGEAIKARGPLPLDEAMPIFERLAGALAAAHADGIVHRDLKVANVALGADGAKLLDFGIAKLADVPTGGFTTPGTKLGTPHYMAPEQILGRAVDARTDVYAFGILVFEVLTGRRPFDGPNLAEIEERQLAEPPPALSERAAVPAALDAVIWRAMDKHPSRRHATIEEAIADLRAAARGEARPPVRSAAVAVYMHPCVAADADDDTLDRVDRLAAEVRRSAATRGLEVAAELGGALLLLATGDARAPADALARDAAAHARRAGLPVAITLRVGEVELAFERTGSRLAGGALLDLSWTRTDEGVHVAI